jgi:polysaccharide biosynthesis transport protein
MEDSIESVNSIPAIASRYWKQILAWNALVLTVAAAGVIVGPRTYIATTRFIMPRATAQFNSNLGTLGSVREGDTSEPADVQNQISILKSNMLLSRVLETDPDKEKFSKLEQYRQLEQYSKLFTIKPEDKTTVFQLSAKGSRPEIATKRVNSLVMAYQQRLNELRTEDKTSRSRFGQKELEKAEKRLLQAQVALTEFKQISGLVSSKAQVEGLVAMINSLMSQQAQMQNLANTSAGRVKTISSQLGAMPDQAIQTMKLSDNQDFQSVRSQLSEVSAAITKARATYQEDHPQVVDLVSQYNKLKIQYLQYVQQAANGLHVDASSSGSGGRAALMLQLVEADNDAVTQRQQAEDLGQKVATLNASLKTLPQKLAILQQLERQYEVSEGVYKGLLTQGKQGNIDVYNTFPNVQVLDSPSISTKSSLLLVLFNALLASGVGTIAITLWLERQNPVLTPKDLHTTKIPILASIPRSKSTGNEWESTPNSEVVFQQLASLVNLQNLENRRLLVTSAMEGEGKTTVVIGLANALVDLGYKVLIVDGDFRKAELSQRIGCVKDWSRSERLARYLEEEFSTVPGAKNTLLKSLLQQALVPIHPNLDLLPTLPQHRKIINLIRQGRFEETLAAVGTIRDYDYTLIDSAPVSLTSETALMAGISEHVIFVVRPNKSRRDAFLNSIEQLTQHKAKILGWAINYVGSPKGYIQYGTAHSSSLNSENESRHSAAS